MTAHRIPERHKIVLHGLQPVGDRRDKPDDDLIIVIRDEVEWPMPRRRPVETTRMTEQEVAEVTRALERAIAEAVAEVNDGADHGHE